jgi:hypothetical protein
LPVTYIPKQRTVALMGLDVVNVRSKCYPALFLAHDAQGIPGKEYMLCLFPSPAIDAVVVAWLYASDILPLIKLTGLVCGC